MYRPKAKPGPKSIQQRTRAALLLLGWTDATATARTGHYVTMRLPAALPRPHPAPPIPAGTCILLGPSGAIRLTPDGTLARSFDISERASLPFILATPLPTHLPPKAAVSPTTPTHPQTIEDLF